jgi:hypothetical protein
MQSKPALIVDNARSYVYVQQILKICISQFFKIIKSKIQKTMIHLVTVTTFRLKRIERYASFNRLLIDSKIE